MFFFLLQHWRDLEVIGIELAGLPALYEAPWEFPNVRKTEIKREI